MKHKKKIIKVMQEKISRHEMMRDQIEMIADTFHGKMGHAVRKQFDDLIASIENEIILAEERVEEDGY